MYTTCFQWELIFFTFFTLSSDKETHTHTYIHTDIHTHIHIHIHIHTYINIDLKALAIVTSFHIYVYEALMHVIGQFGPIAYRIW